jgi:hypothetical protein
VLSTLYESRVCENCGGDPERCGCVPLHRVVPYIFFFALLVGVVILWAVLT